MFYSLREETGVIHKIKLEMESYGEAMKILNKSEKMKPILEQYDEGDDFYEIREDFDHQEIIEMSKNIMKFEEEDK